MKSARAKDAFAAVLDILLWPLLVPAAVLLKGARRVGLHRLKWCRRALLRIGVLPVRHHYYEPFVHPAELRHSPEQERLLPGIEWNAEAQLSLLAQMSFEHELEFLTEPRTSELDARLDNGSFESGDAEYLYQLIRVIKPLRIIEIGSGNSTLIARAAIARNAVDVPGYFCRHVCIEPFEAPWLERAGVTTLRKRVEDVDRELFRELEAGDLLFIDSSHVIRPQGDVLTEYLQILPILRPGVFVHIHDIFTPRDYPQEWMIDRLAFWNEQYVLEAFLTQNPSWEIVGALNWLHHHHFDALHRVCPFLTADREPGSFYVRKLR